LHSFAGAQQEQQAEQQAEQQIETTTAGVETDTTSLSLLSSSLLRKICFVIHFI
jgi:hypothetical protein